MSHSSIRLPAEWEHQDGVLLVWPTATSDWADSLAEIETVFIELAATISCYERVIIVTHHPHSIRTKLLETAADLDNIICYTVDSNDTWARDFGPISVVIDDTPALYDFTFNGWGLKFPANQDNQITHRLFKQQAFRCPVITQGLVLEGGSIESDGAGTILTTSECLLSPNRNPHLTKAQLEDFFSTHCGAKQVLWLDHGYLAGDDTDSHIDTLARLCPNDTIVYTACDQGEDEHFDALKAMEKQLETFLTLQGTPYKLQPLPWPQAQFSHDNERLPATYANFLIINKAVLVPVYDDPADNAALEILTTVFPHHKVIGINCKPVILQHGSLHCLTMQFTQGTLS